MKEVGRFAVRGMMMVPQDKAARQIVAKLGEGGAAFLEAWKPRNMSQHRAYFAMLNNVVEASGLWSSREALEYELALTMGRGDYIELRNGRRRFEPHSRAVASMSREDFERLHSDTVKLLTDWLGCDPEALREQAA